MQRMRVVGRQIMARWREEVSSIGAQGAKAFTWTPPALNGAHNMTDLDQEDILEPEGLC